ncbi:MAG TPA: dynamin family protein [Alphaproteobacteria bacterium]|nr:dynamin family protein [Alphaproteobacteria bacterium]
MIDGRDAADYAGREATPDVERLKTYSHLKLSLAGQLRALRHVFKASGHEGRQRQCAELQVKLAEDRFTLAVVGQFKRGKSSLLNAIIGRDVLPTGVLPLTSAITMLKFGPQERLVIRRDGLQFPEIAPLERLAEYVTERGNPGNCKKVATATVEVPLPFLRRGLEFVDTPGIGSAIRANTATTYAFLPQCDVVLFVTGVDSPFTSVEFEFLGALRQHVRKIFFVVNKVDLLGERERREVLEFVANTLREHLGTDDVRLFPLSCRFGLAAKADGDTLAYARSGLKVLEEELGRFLAEEKSATFLAAIADRALRLLEAEAREVELSKRARQLPRAVFQRQLDEVQRQWQRHAALRRDIFQKMRQHVLAELRVVLRSEIDTFLSAERARTAPRIRRLLRHASWQPCARMSRRVAERELRHFRRRVSRWLAGCVEKLTFATDDVCRALWNDLERNLGEIPDLAVGPLIDQGPRLAVKPADRPRPEGLPPWRLEVKLESAFSADALWSTRIPWWLKPWPCRLARSRLMKRQEWEHTRLMESSKGPLLAAVEDRFNAALDRLWDEVSGRAAEIEGRIRTNLAGERPVDASEAALSAIRGKLLVLRAEILGLPIATPSACEQPPVLVEPSSSTPTIEPDMAPPAPADIAKHLNTRGCPVCDQLSQVAFRFFAHWQYALSSDERTRAQFAMEGGFCALHAWQLEAISSPVGSSVGYAPLAARISRVLAEAAPSPEPERAVRQLLRDGRTCRACRLLGDAARRYAGRLAVFLTEPRNRAAYARARGVCLRHLALLIALSDRQEVVPFLLSQAARRFEEVAEDMQAFTMKTDALRNADEVDAYWRAITHIVGAKSVSLPWPGDMEIGG